MNAATVETTRSIWDARQLGEDREREHLARCALGFGHVAGLVPQVPETLLQVEGIG